MYKCVSLEYEPASVKGSRVHTPQCLYALCNTRYALCNSVGECTAVNADGGRPFHDTESRLHIHIGRAQCKRLDTPVLIEDAPLDVTFFRRR